jgi:integrase
MNTTHPTAVLQPEAATTVLHILKQAPPDGPNYANLVALYLEAKAVTLMASTIAHYKYILERFVDWLEDRPLDGPTINAFLLELKAQGKSDWYRRNFHRTLKTFIYWLLDEEYIRSDPFRGRGRVQPIKLKRKRRRTYTEEEVIRLLTARPAVSWMKRKPALKRRQWRRDGPMVREDDQCRALVLLLIDSALRAAEVCRLNCGDIRASELVVISKGGHEDVAFVSATTRRVLLELAGERPDNDPLLRDWRGRRCTSRALRGMIERLAERADVDLPPRHVHAFRHFAAQVWARAKLPDVVIMKLMRHTSVETTRIYTAMGTEDLGRLHAAASPVDRLLALADLRGQDDAPAEGGA